MNKNMRKNLNPSIFRFDQIKMPISPKEMVKVEFQLPGEHKRKRNFSVFSTAPID
jgi:hypothetical protein